MLETMSTTNRDASETTRRRANLVQFGWRKELNYPQAALPGRPEQPANSAFEGPTAEVPMSVKLGALLVGQSGATCACSSSVTLQGYDKRAPASC
jgi:hypothetical protein